MNNLESICCNFEWSKKLKEAGFPQKTSFYYGQQFGHSSWILNIIHIGKWTGSWKNIASPTAEEILRELPSANYVDFGKSEVNDYYCSEFGKDETYRDEKLCNALAEMYCYLAENKLLEGK